MTIATTTVWEVRTTGSDANGGGFNPARGGTDYSQQNSPQATGTATVSGTTLTATTGIFTSAMVGNLVTDGTSWREITAFTSSTVVTIDSSVSWTGASIKVGGGLASPGMAAGLKVPGNTVFVKYNASPYVVSTTTANVSGGRIDDLSQVDGVVNYWVGYDTTRTVTNTDANRPTLQIAASGVTAIDMFVASVAGGPVNLFVTNLVFDGNSKAGIGGVNCGGDKGVFANCKAVNCVTGFTNGAAGSRVVRCEASGNTTGFSSSGGASKYFYCYAHDNTGDGFAGYVDVNSIYLGCIAGTNGGWGFGGTFAFGTLAFNCASYNNSSGGFKMQSNTRMVVCVNCIASQNTGYGWDGDGTCVLLNCADHGNSSGRSDPGGIAFNQGAITLTADPFTNAAGGDFSLNNTAGGGAACRAAGFPGAFPGGAMTGYLDIGAVQHADPAGGASGPAAIVRLVQNIGTY